MKIVSSVSTLWFTKLTSIVKVRLEYSHVCCQFLKAQVLMLICKNIYSKLRSVPSVIFLSLRVRHGIKRNNSHFTKSSWRDRLCGFDNKQHA